MNSRRITLHPPAPDKDAMPPKLKQLAGLIQGLSYREMNQLSELLFQQGNLNIAATYVAEALLKISDQILETK